MMFNDRDNAIVFDQKFVEEGKLKELDVDLKNKYINIKDRFLNHIKDIVEEEIKEIQKPPIILTSEWEKPPTMIIKAAKSAYKKGSECNGGDGVCVNMNSSPSNVFLLNVINYMCFHLDIGLTLTLQEIVTIAKNEVITLYNNGTSESLVEMLKNKNAYVNYHLKNDELESILVVMTKQDYPLSEFELGIVANMLGINIVIFTGKTTRNPENFIVLNSLLSSDTYIILNRKTKKNVDHYDIVTNNKEVFFSKELDGVFLDTFMHKSKHYG